MKGFPKGWKISQRDGGNRFIKNKPSKELTDVEKEELKQKIIQHHESLGLPKGLKKEIYPELFS